MDFLGGDTVWLQPGAEEYPLSFGFSACSSATANDGSIPYGTTISSATVVITDPTGTDKTSEVQNGSVSVSGGLTVQFLVDYSAPNGRYAIDIKVTLSSGAKIPFDWNGLCMGDRSG